MSQEGGHGTEAGIFIGIQLWVAMLDVRGVSVSPIAAELGIGSALRRR